MPDYLSSLLPQNVGNASRYSLRNSDNLQTIFSRTTLYSNSFLPSSIRAWKNLPTEARQIASIDTFKQFLNSGREKVPKYFYCGSRRDQLLHTRLRTNCSNLNNDLFQKNITDSPLCLCGNLEDDYHFLLVCPLYARQRIILHNSIAQYQFNLTLDLLLFDDLPLSYDANMQIFETVQKYIIDTKRF